MTLPARIVDHVTQGLSKLTTPFKNRPRFKAWCSSQLRQTQEEEDMLYAFFSAYDLDTCDLTRLRQIAKIVGQTEVGNLETFRRLVKVRILVNRTDTTAPTLIKIAMLLLGGPISYEDGGCYIHVEALEPLPLDVDGATLAGILREAKMAGVRLMLVAQTEEDGLLLGGDEAWPGADDAAHGLADGALDGTGTTTGGYLAGDF